MAGSDKRVEMEEEERMAGTAPDAAAGEGQLGPGEEPEDALSGEWDDDDGPLEDGILPYLEDDEAMQEQSAVGVPVDEVLRHMKHRCQSSQLHVDFVRYVPFLIMFCFFFFAGRDITSNYYVVRVVKDILMGNELPRSEVLKTYEGIANSADYTMWLQDVVVPNLWKDCGRSEPLRNLPPPYNVQLYAQGQNYLLGALRLRTHRVTPDSCGVNGNLFENATGRSCFSPWSTSSQQVHHGGWLYDKATRGVDFLPPFPHPKDWSGHDIVYPTEPHVYRVEWPSTGAQLGEFRFQWEAETVVVANVTVTGGTNPGAAVDLNKATAWRSENMEPLVITFPAPTATDQYSFTTPTCTDCPNLRDPIAWRFEARLNPADPWVLLHEYAADAPYATPLPKGTPLGWFPDDGPLRAVNGSRVWRQYRFTPLLTRGMAMPQDRADYLYSNKACSDFQDNSLTSYIIGDIDQYHCGGYIVDIPFNESCAVAMDVVRALGSTNYPFYDNYATRLVIIEFFLYSVQMGTFTSVKLFNEQASCGGWINKWQIRSFLVWTDRNIEQTVFDFFFLAFVLYFWYRFFVDWVNTYRGFPPGDLSTKGKFAAFMIPSASGQSIWALLELANLCVFLAVFGIRFAWWGMSMNLTDSTKFPFPPQYPAELDKLLNLYMLQVYSNAVNTVITFLKFLKYVRLNSRLNILTATIALKADSMFACLVIFVYILLAYALAGYALFGSTTPDYRTVDRSLSTLMRMLLGDFDYVTLRNENRVLAGFFFWSFTVIGLFLMLNFLIAILSEGFAQVSEKQTEVPLEEQMVRAWVNFKRSLRPWYLMQGVRMALKGNSRASVLARATIELEQKKMILEEGDELLEIDGEDETTKLVYRKELPVYMGKENYDLLGNEYVNEVWDDVLYSWRIIQMNTEKQQDIDDQTMVEEAVSGAVKGRLEEVDNMDAKMRGLEMELNSLVSLLQTTSTIPR
eukprot:TRINITY_DN2357_c0_g2_i1.p1 TRINITY_DN2357_c0_g2~~TRINITY_DN2357_c0_g2_i1.p1  ORF type:complete len:965 (+),score=330.14 TRINITY_DN2357_c0_g2_i1:126-3020(+)